MKKRLVEAAVRGIADQLLVNLGRNALHDHPWMHHALANALPHDLNCLVHQYGKGVQPRDPVFVIFGGFKTERVGQVIDCLDALALIQWQQEPVKFVAFHTIFIPLLKQIVVKLLGGRERIAISVLLFSIVSNVAPLILTTSTSVFARAVAVRGRSSSTLISPKKSPFSRVARTLVSPAIVLMSSTVPAWRMNMSLPISPSEKMMSPIGYWTT